MMRGVPERSGKPSSASFTGDFVAGLRYVRSTPFVMSLLLISCVVSLSGRSYQQLLPAFSSDVLKVGPEGLGLMMAAPGAGTVLGTAALATMRDVRYKGRAFIGGMLLLSLALVAFSVQPLLPRCPLGILFLIGVASAGVQHHDDDHAAARRRAGRCAAASWLWSPCRSRACSPSARCSPAP